MNVIGYPECQLILSQTAIYLACSVKSNASYKALLSAQKAFRELGDLPVPLPIRNAPTNLMKNIGYGKDYKYAHDYENNFVDLESCPLNYPVKNFTTHRIIHAKKNSEQDSKRCGKTNTGIKE